LVNLPVGLYVLTCFPTAVSYYIYRIRRPDTRAPWWRLMSASVRSFMNFRLDGDSHDVLDFGDRCWTAGTWSREELYDSCCSSGCSSCSSCDARCVVAPLPTAAIAVVILFLLAVLASGLCINLASFFWHLLPFSSSRFEPADRNPYRMARNTSCRSKNVPPLTTTASTFHKVV